MYCVSSAETILPRLVHYSILVGSSTSISSIDQPTSNTYSAWLGWFPVLFYTTVYIGELHKRSQPPPSPSSAAALEAEATRLGSRALLYSSLVSLAGNIVLPFFVKEAGSGGAGADGLKGMLGGMGWWKGRWKVHLASLWAASHLVFALCMGATL